MKEAVIGLGTNLCDKEQNLKRAIESIQKLPKTTILEVSSIYLTSPYLVPDKQDDYLNCCIKIKTELQPKTLLGCCLGIEAAMGRQRPYKNAARIIDMDLILYENALFFDDDLILPHPRIKERAFVLIPLSDLYNDKLALGFDFNEALNCINTEGIHLYKKVL